MSILKRWLSAVVVASIVASSFPTQTRAEPVEGVFVGGAAIVAGLWLLSFYVSDRCAHGKTHAQAMKDTQDAIDRVIRPLVDGAKKEMETNRRMLGVTAWMIAVPLIDRYNTVHGAICERFHSSSQPGAVTLDDFFEDQRDLLEGLVIPFIQYNCPDDESGGSFKVFDRDRVRVQMTPREGFRTIQLIILRALSDFLMKFNPAYSAMNLWEKQQLLSRIWNDKIKKLLGDRGMADKDCWENLYPSMADLQKNVFSVRKSWWKLW